MKKWMNIYQSNTYTKDFRRWAKCSRIVIFVLFNEADTIKYVFGKIS